MAGGLRLTFVTPLGRGDANPRAWPHRVDRSLPASCPSSLSSFTVHLPRLGSAPRSQRVPDSFRLLLRSSSSSAHTNPPPTSGGVKLQGGLNREQSSEEGVRCGRVRIRTWGVQGPLKVHLRSRAPTTSGSVPARGPCERGCCLLRRTGRRWRFSAWTADPGGTCSQAPRRLKPHDLAMREPRKGFGARLARFLTGLGGRRERRGKISKETRLPDR